MEYIIELMGGPFTFRFVMQPVLAIILGLRDGRKDAKSNAPLILPMLLLESGKRGETLKGALKRVTVPLIISVVMDSIVQITVFEVLRLQWALVVGVCLVGIPYLLSREITNRIASSVGEKGAANG